MNIETSSQNTEPKKISPKKLFENLHLKSYPETNETIKSKSKRERLQLSLKLPKEIPLDIIKKYIKGPNAQLHAKKGLENFLKLNPEIKKNLADLIKIFPNINWEIVGGLGIKESKFEINAESSKGAKGIFQVKIFEQLKKHYNSTNKYKGSEEKFLSSLRNNPEFVRVYKKMPREALGIAFLSYLITKYNGDLEKALGHYNSGKANYSEWGKETKGYVLGDASVLNYGNVFGKILRNNHEKNK